MVAPGSFFDKSILAPHWLIVLVAAVLVVLGAGYKLGTAKKASDVALVNLAQADEAHARRMDDLATQHAMFKLRFDSVVARQDTLMTWTRGLVRVTCRRDAELATVVLPCTATDLRRSRRAASGAE